MNTLEPLLAEQSFFHGLEPRYLQLITGCASNTRFAADQYIFYEGEEANQFYLIRHGKVALETFAPGRGVISIDTLMAGEVLGWSWLFAPYRWHFSAKALEVTRAIALDGACLREKCAEDHDFGYELMSRFAQTIILRLQATRLQLLNVYQVGR